MPPTTPQPPVAPPPVPSLPDLAITRAADMAMSPHPDRGAKLRQCIDRLPQAEASTALTLVERRIEEAICRLGLEDVLAFDVGGLEDGLKLVHVLEQGSGGEWRATGRFIRLAAIYRLTPNGSLPLRLSADALPSPTAFHQLPLIMALYKIIGHSLAHQGTSLALQQANNDGAYRIGDQSFRVVPLSELPANHPYRSGYQRTDPVIRHEDLLFPSFWSFLVRLLVGMGNRYRLIRRINHDDPRYRRLLTETITKQQGGIAVDYRRDFGDLNHANPDDDRRLVIVSGFRPNERVAAHLEVWGRIDLLTTEASAGGRSQPLTVRFPTSLPLWRAVLSHFHLGHRVINRFRLIL
ncbi:unnamed protein product [Vitrella brassicaformis CCMP3155]|uniref:Uncharacterized protein n=1 Tax=Vitrella brassicaformis (strain CCMP3155) TaxID=1169540 RepID=A0A0G4GIU2_VITBC|nr:unnamed protein product [Vitrella brassicaformis CCMP3155]|eukprot:CEM29761.1 unnamed protein product [Vitrella brassicaformis CCMP3155]